jgi:hypothetical protein
MQFTYPYSHKGRPSYKRSLQLFIPQKRTSSTSKLEFPSRLCARIPNALPDPDPADQK